MGSFSWTKADKLTNIRNIARGLPFKFLVPKEFGGMVIEDDYQGFGLLGTKDDGPKYDIYELLALWNAPELVRFNGEFDPMKEIDEHTDHNRSIGIDIGCYDYEIEKLKYPLKLVSSVCDQGYEEVPDPSFGDPDQGFFPAKRSKK